MYLKDIIGNKFAMISSAALILVPYFTWKSLYNSYNNLKNKYDEEVLFYKRHNCVVIYSGVKGMSGWPPHTERVKLDFNNQNCLAELREPIIYFIDTAKKSLELAFMMINVNSVYKALIRAHQRGVKVRILLNFEHCEGKLSEIRNLIKEGIFNHIIKIKYFELNIFIGIEVLTYVSQGISSIMHCKYMVKDYTESSGFLFTGSLNLTDSGFINNYEDVVFTSNQYVVKAFHENFEECWNFVKIDNEDLINKTTLLDANLI